MYIGDLVIFKKSNFVNNGLVKLESIPVKKQVVFHKDNYGLYTHILSNNSNLPQIHILLNDEDFAVNNIKPLCSLYYPSKSNLKLSLCDIEKIEIALSSLKSPYKLNDTL